MRKMNRILKVKSILFPFLGAICILFADKISCFLPYLLGSAMVLVGVLMVIIYFQEKKFLEKQSDELAYSIMILIMGIAFLFKGINSLEALGITWAIIGIRKASKSLNGAIWQLFYRKKHFIVPLVEFLIRIMLSLLLLFNPIEKFSNHVIILGLELIAISIPFARLFSGTIDEPL